MARANAASTAGSSPGRTRAAKASSDSTPASMHLISASSRPSVSKATQTRAAASLDKTHVAARRPGPGSRTDAQGSSARSPSRPFRARTNMRTAPSAHPASNSSRWVEVHASVSYPRLQSWCKATGCHPSSRCHATNRFSDAAARQRPLGASAAAPSARPWSSTGLSFTSVGARTSNLFAVATRTRPSRATSKASHVAGFAVSSEVRATQRHSRVAPRRCGASA